MNRITQENLTPLKRRISLALTLVCALLAPALAQAESASAEESLQSQVSAAIDLYLADLKSNRYTRMEADVQSLDPRLQLSLCSVPPDVEHYPRERIGGRITFKVTCSDTGGWSVRVPANLQVYDFVVVASNSIPMGTQLTGSELTEQEMDVALQYRGYFRNISDVKGFVTKRPIPAGQVLSPITVNPANLVNKGETVAILAETPGLTIRAVGVAMADGAMGDVIQVKNTKSNKVVEGRIFAPGQVKVAL